PLLLLGVSAWTHAAALHWGFVALGLFVSVGTALFVTAQPQAVIILFTVVSAVGYGYNVVLTRPLNSIHVSSPLVDTIKRETRDGSRYAKVGANLDGLLPSNQESLLQIKGIGSYDSLSSTNYQRLALTLNASGTANFGRTFGSIAPPTDSEATFDDTGIGVLVSRDDLDARQFVPAGKVGGINVYRTRTPPILRAQLTRFRRPVANTVITGGPLSADTSLRVEEIEHQDDDRRFVLTAAGYETVLFVSEQYHPQWQASSAGRRLATVLIDDFYLGAI